MMNKLRARVDRLEVDQIDMQQNVAFITYSEQDMSESEAISVWETSNGPLTNCAPVFFTVYEGRPKGLL